MDLKKFLQSGFFRKLPIAVGILAAVAVSFAAGLFVGRHEARFSNSWSEYYERNFVGPRRGFIIPSPQFTSPNGALGTVVSAGSSTLVISGDDGVEKNILISSSTILREFRSDIQISDVKTGERAVVVGSPTNDGRIEASFIRIFPR